MEKKIYQQQIAQYCRLLYKFYKQMSSFIQAIVQKYRLIVEKVESLALESDEQKANAIRLQKLGQRFIGLIIELNCSDQQIIKMPQQAIKGDVDRLLQREGKKRKIERNFLKRMFGQYIKDEFDNNIYFNGLNKEFQSNYEQELIKKEEEEFSEQFSMFLSSIHEQQGDLQSTKTEDNNQSIRVMKYLMEIGPPQTQLLQLCQQLKWKLSFNQKLPSQGLFEIVVNVDYDCMGVSKGLRESFKAKQKKVGRVVASFKMLRNIYLNFPQIMVFFLNKKKKRFVNEKNPFNIIDLLQEEQMNDNKASLLQAQRIKFQEEKETYLQKIVSFKSQLNQLRQQMEGVFTYNLDKVQINNTIWKVNGLLKVNYSEVIQTFEACEQHYNSKLAEQKMIKMLLTKMYNKCQDILQKIMIIKTKKGIKT